MIVGLSRDSLKAKDAPRKSPDVLCPDIDPTPIEHDIQDLKRTEYLTKYCSRVNLARRARALQTLRLPDDVYIPDTSQKSSYRHPSLEKYKDPPSAMSMRPKFDDSLQRELRRILRIHTGDSAYMATHSLLGKVILDKNPFGPPREEPHFGRWRTPYYYTYYMHI
ncbi:hypothetical protein MSG28_009400 [Choristoneura fumiferana]|uniref:Uncharacterized protein n=1 Tax=Choristoneura fumiferana TaxID=7141 RepID=A0ACC0KXW7_CHOFU|nr:hypothetical protein MSG28_009400 [Choristoneura fumiferana]